MNKYFIVMIVALFIFTGCVSKTVPKNMSKLKQVSSLKQFEGCYLSLPDNSHVGNNLARRMIKVDYQTSKNIYKVCFEAVGNEKLLSVGYDLRGKYIGKGELKLGNEIKINENRLILHSDYGLPTPKGSDAGLMVAATTESTFLAMDIEGNLIKSSTWSGAGAAVILFLPVPILTHTEYTYLYKKTH